MGIEWFLIGVICGVATWALVMIWIAIGICTAELQPNLYPRGTLSPRRFEQILREYFNIHKNIHKRCRPKLTQAQHQARKLLKKLLSLEEWKRFQRKGYFIYIDRFKNRWKFINRFHYPILFNEERICIDADDEAPIEDLLIQCYLEVRGGRGDKLLKSSFRIIDIVP